MAVFSTQFGSISHVAQQNLKFVDSTAILDIYIWNEAA